MTLISFIIHYFFPFLVQLHGKCLLVHTKFIACYTCVKTKITVIIVHVLCIFLFAFLLSEEYEPNIFHFVRKKTPDQGL